MAYNEVNFCLQSELPYDPHDQFSGIWFFAVKCLTQISEVGFFMKIG